MTKQDEVKWLSAEERAAWLSLGALMNKLPAALDAQLQEDEGLSYFEYMILAMLSEQEDRSMQMSDLANLIAGSLSRLSHAAKRLENQGYMWRERMPGPGRKTRATITQKGYDKVVAAAPGHVTRVRELVIDSASPEQLQAVSEVLLTILRKIDPEDPLAGASDSQCLEA